MANLKKNITYNFIYQVLILFLPLITAPYLSRVIGASGIGVYSYSYSIALYFTCFTMLGLNNYGNRSIASVQEDYEARSKTFSEIYCMQMLSFVFCCVTYIFYIFVFASNRTAALIQGVFVLSSLFDFNWFFFGMEQFKLTVTRNTIIKLLTVACIFTFVKNSGDVYKYIAIMACGTFASQLCLWPFLKRYIHITRVSFRNIKKHFAPNLVLFVPVIAVSIYRIMDKVMLGYMSSMTDLGYFENAEKIINVPVALITAIGTVMLPRMTALISSNKIDESQMYIDKTMLMVLAFANMAMFGIIAISKEFSVLFYGSNFTQTGVIMNYLAVTIVFLACGNVIRTQYLIPSKKDKIFITSAILGAIVNFTSNLLMIPHYASVGAAIGTIIAEFVVCFYQLFCVRKAFHFGKYLIYELVFLVAALIMYIDIRVVPTVSNVYMTLFIHLITGAVVYGFLAGIYIIKVERVPIFKLIKKNGSAS